MFLLYTMNEIVVIKPNNMTGDSYSAVLKALQDKYLFKNIENEGLCVEIAGFTINECIIVNGEGDFQYHINLKLVIFKAFENELLTGTIKRSIAAGIEVSLGFTDVFVPAKFLPEPKHFDKYERIWYYIFEKHELAMPLDEKIMIKVISSSYSKQEHIVDNKAYNILGACNEEGTGLLAWLENMEE